MDQNEYELEHAKSMAWERDAINRLFYGLWIVFLGGFVLSLRVIVYRHFRLAALLVIAFRVLAVAGTAVNFFMQFNSIGSLSSVRMGLFFKAVGDLNRAKEAIQRARNSVQLDARCEKYLQVIAALFLLVALGGSFLVHLP